MNRCLSLSLVLLVAPLACAAAQQRAILPDAACDDPMVPIHTAAADPVGGAYGVWAGGPDYKVSFDGGVRFVPLLGRSAARNAEWTWRTVSVRIGSTELLDGGRPHGRVASERRYEYRLGSVTEAYDVGPAGVEQTFVLSERPSGAGDLVIVGAVGGNVHGVERAAAHAPLVFCEDGGRAVVGYGVATVVDRDGVVAPMTTALIDGRIELRLDAQRLEGLAWPLVVDPLLDNQVIGVDTGVQDFDVYRDDQQALSNVWVVYSRAASATDVDLLVRRYPDSMSGPGVTVYSDLATGWSSVGGQLAGVGGVGGGVGKTIAAFTREFSSGPRRVRWHTHRKDDVTLQTGYGSVSSPVDHNEWRPDVGGTRSDGTGRTALLVFQREANTSSTFSNRHDSAVYGVRIDTTGAGSGVQSAPIAIADLGSGDCERPTVNQVAEGGPQFSWVVVHQEHDNSPTGSWDVVARRVPENVGNLGGREVVANDPQVHEVSPKVEGAFGRYLIVWGQRDRVVDKPTDVLAREVIMRRYDWSHLSPSIRPRGENEYLVTNPDLRYRLGEVGFDLRSRSHWCATYTDSFPGRERLYACKVGYEGEVSQRNIAYDVPGFQPLPCGVGYDQDNERFTMVWGVDNGFSSNPIVTAYLDYDPAAAPLPYGVGCAVGAVQSFEGSQHIGGEFETWRVQTNDVGIPALLVLGTRNTFVSLDGIGMTGCGLAVDSGSVLGTLLATTDIIGDAEVTLPIPSRLFPFNMRSQWFLLQQGVNAAGLTSTCGLRVSFSW